MSEESSTPEPTIYTGIGRHEPLISLRSTIKRSVADSYRIHKARARNPGGDEDAVVAAASRSPFRSLLKKLEKRRTDAAAAAVEIDSKSMTVVEEMRERMRREREVRAAERRFEKEVREQERNGGRRDVMEFPV